MIEIWKFYPGNKIQILASDGTVTHGVVECVIDVDEHSDLENQEDSIGIITIDGSHIEFYVSDIVNITVIDETKNEKEAIA